MKKESLKERTTFNKTLHMHGVVHCDQNENRIECVLAIDTYSENHHTVTLSS